MQRIKTFSLTDEQYKWEDFEQDAKLKGYNSSQFLTYLYKDYKEKRYRDNINTTIVFMMLGFVILALLIIWRTGW